jgi:N-acetyl sugar amidotransferase
MINDNYRICNRCIMDTTDPEIRFDSDGNCSHCNAALELGAKTWFPDDNGGKILDSLIERIKKEGRNKEFDCVVGLSGGVDSSYLAYLAVKKGLRPLIVHVDCGWNSEQAVRNVENVVKKLNLELHTFVVNWEEMKDLQRSFFKASLPDQDIPQDHAIFAALYNFAEKNNVTWVLNGYNFATESILPQSWGYQAMDYRHLKSIQKKFGEIKLKDYPHVNFFKRYIWYTLIKRMQIVNPLNYIDYRKDEAIETMKSELGWQYYGGKHFESRFTKFFQSYYLPLKFNYDKRRAHLSSLIMSGQITRDEALAEMDKSLYSEGEIKYDLEYVAKKLGWSADEFRTIIDLPPAAHKDFPNNESLFEFGRRLKQSVVKLLGK